MQSLTTVVALSGELEFCAEPNGNDGGHVNVWVGDSMLVVHCTAENARKLARAFHELATEGGQK